MKCLILLIGESFRLGGQGSRNRGHDHSKRKQLDACNTHIKFFEFLKDKFNYDVELSICSYTTKFDNIIKDFYNKYLIKSQFFDDVIGLPNLFHYAYSDISLSDYEFIFYFRIDIFLKDFFFDIFNPSWKTIHFSTTTWIIWNELYGDPRVNDVMLFIPKKYFSYLKNIEIHHELWHNLIFYTDLTYSDLDVMLETLHDSDSEKDYNPLYYIVNRPETKNWYSKGHFFEKKTIEKFVNMKNYLNIKIIFTLIILIIILYLL